MRATILNKTVVFYVPIVFPRPGRAVKVHIAHLSGREASPGGLQPPARTLTRRKSGFPGTAVPGGVISADCAAFQA